MITLRPIPILYKRILKFDKVCINNISFFLGDQRFLLANFHQSKVKSSEPTATTDAISKNNYLAAKKSLALTTTYIRAIYANSAWTFIGGKQQL